MKNGIFTLDVLTYNDYYPFGMLLPNRHDNTPEYRYGFQGQEMDDEIKGEGNSLDYGERMYDPRINRFIARDPKWREYMFLSPYVYAVNNPIRYVDIFGAGPGDRIKAAKKHLKTVYKQQSELELRTKTNKKALEFMDCSELICRVLAADEFTDGVDNMATSDYKLQNWLKANWKESKTPKKGDIIIWKGHTALVAADYEEGDKRIKVIHATKYNAGEPDEVASVVEESYKVSYYKGKGAKYYTPINDMPEDLDDKSKDNAMREKKIKNLNSQKSFYEKYKSALESVNKMNQTLGDEKGKSETNIKIKEAEEKIKKIEKEIDKNENPVSTNQTNN